MGEAFQSVLVWKCQSGVPVDASTAMSGALLERLHAVQARGRVERRGERVGGAFHRRADPGAFGGRLLIGVEDGTAVPSDLARPGQLLDERLRQEQLAARAVEHVEEAIAVGVQEEPARLPLPVGVNSIVPSWPEMDVRVAGTRGSVNQKVKSVMIKSVVAWSAPSAGPQGFWAGINLTAVLTGKVQALVDFIGQHRAAKERRVAGIRLHLRCPGRRSSRALRSTG
jgi:hypothetical protein